LEPKGGKMNIDSWDRHDEDVQKERNEELTKIHQVLTNKTQRREVVKALVGHMGKQETLELLWDIKRIIMEVEHE
jgi:translation elongation factor EF-G